MNELSQILSKFVFDQLTKELVRQGHVMTGSLVAGFEVKVRESMDSIDIDFMMDKYGLSLNYGIKPSKIPYTIGGPPRGGTSKYIEGLMRFARIKLHAKDKRTEKQIAFAIARKQKQKGYPLTGKIGFFDNVLEADNERILDIIQDYYEALIDFLFDEFTKINK